MTNVVSGRQDAMSLLECFVVSAHWASLSNDKEVMFVTLTSSHVKETVAMCSSFIDIFANLLSYFVILS